MARSLVGTRIRQRRRSLGLRQAALAQAAGISASYLNLIEHNRRSAAGKVIASIARELSIPISALTEGAEAELVETLQDAQLNTPINENPVEPPEELISRFPGWADVIAAQTRQLRAQSAAMTELNDRINYDPVLQNTLYEMLTTITAIRSTSGILASDAEMGAPERIVFERAIETEAERLSDAAQDLVRYFDRAEEQTRAPARPSEAYDGFLTRNDHAFPALEDCDDPEVEIRRIVAADPLLVGTEAQMRATHRLRVFAADARALPLEPFLELAQKSGFSPAALSRSTGESLLRVFRRLATLRREGIDAPAFGLVIINAAGQPVYRRPLRGFSLPKFTSICALWPVFQALTTPSSALEDVLVMPNGAEYFARAIAEPAEPATFGQRSHLLSGMLVTPLNEAFSFGMMERAANIPSLQVSTSCRLCPKSDCRLRSEPGLVDPT